MAAEWGSLILQDRLVRGGKNPLFAIPRSLPDDCYPHFLLQDINWFCSQFRENVSMYFSPFFS